MPTIKLKVMSTTVREGVAKATGRPYYIAEITAFVDKKVIAFDVDENLAKTFPKFQDISERDMTATLAFSPGDRNKARVKIMDLK